jgi:hypothetical protein
MDRELGVCEEISARVPEWRGCCGARHSLSTLVRQRVYQIACGYEDQNGANTLRSDPLLRLVLGRLPEAGEDLASQPTLSRLENAPGARDCLRIARTLLELYVRERGKDGAPERVLLDLDSTDDPTHGDQEGSRYHGLLRSAHVPPLARIRRRERPADLITAVLRPGNSHAGRGAVAVLKRLVGRLREAWPAVEMEVRADAGFALPAIYEWCEREEIGYTAGLVPNPRLERIAEPLLDRAERESGELAGEKVRLWWRTRLTGPAVGIALVGWSTKPRRWSKAPTPASSSPAGGAPSRRSSTTGTWGAARRKGG